MTKAQAISEIEWARAELLHQVSRASQDWNPQSLLKRGFRQPKVLWFLGAVVVGLLLTRLLPGNRAAVAGTENTTKKKLPYGWLLWLTRPLLQHLPATVFGELMKDLPKLMKVENLQRFFKTH